MKIFSLILTLIIISNIYSQSNEGHIEVSYDFEMNFNEKKKFKSTLYLSDSKSIFFWGNNLKGPSLDEGDTGNDFTISVYEGDSIGSYNSTSIESNTIVSRTLWLNKEVLKVKEDIPKLKWEILESQKLIGEFNCQKARTTFRGRTYFAWFTSEIPTNFGPWKFHGLPGLILKITDVEGEVNLYAKNIINLPNKGLPEIVPEEYTEISINEYAKLQKNLDKELRKKLMAKLPRGAEVEISSFDSLERFDDK